MLSKNPVRANEIHITFIYRNSMAQLPRQCGGAVFIPWRCGGEIISSSCQRFYLLDIFYSRL